MSKSIYVPENVYIDDVIYSPGGTLGPRVQLNIQLVFLHSGSLTIWVDEEKQVMQAGHVMLLLPAHREYFEFDKQYQTEHSYMHWYNDPMPEKLLSMLENLPRILSLSNTMNHLVERGLALRYSSLPTVEQLSKLIAMEMLWQYIGESEVRINEARNTHKNHIFSAARQFIHQHYNEGITLSDIADASSVSETHLIRIFNKYAQTTPINYLWDLRITQALELLHRTGLSISEIASQTGFKTSYHFSRRIREKTGLTPTEYRKNLWG